MTGSNLDLSNLHLQFLTVPNTPQKLILQPMTPQSTSQSINDQFVLQLAPTTSPETSTSATGLSISGIHVDQGVITSPVEMSLTGLQDEHRNISLSQSMVQTELSIPVDANELTPHELTTANMEGKRV